MGAAGKLFEIESVGGGAHLHAFIRMSRLEREHRTDRHKALRLLGLLWAGGNELQIENIIGRLAVEERHELGRAPTYRADQSGYVNEVDFGVHRRAKYLDACHVQTRHFHRSAGAGRSGAALVSSLIAFLSTALPGRLPALRQGRPDKSGLQ